MKSMDSVLYFFPFYLAFFWEITLTVTYIHNSSYVLFMAFQQLCNPRGWKYFPFATVTRALERKYKQLQASLIMVSDNTLFGMSVYHFSLTEKAGLLLRHLRWDSIQTVALRNRSKCFRIGSIYNALLRDFRNQPTLTIFFRTRLAGFKLGICAVCEYSEFSLLQLNSSEEKAACRSMKPRRWAAVPLLGNIHCMSVIY